MEANDMIDKHGYIFKNAFAYAKWMWAMLNVKNEEQFIYGINEAEIMDAVESECDSCIDLRPFPELSTI